MVDLVDGLEFGIDFLQQRVAKRMKSAESDAFGAFRIGLAAFARRRDHAMLHFRRRFVRERQPQDFLARKFRLRFEQIADALGDDARLSRARAGHHHQRALRHDARRRAVPDSAEFPGTERRRVQTVQPWMNP